MSEVDEVKTKIVLAHRELCDLCTGDRKFTMCIPARKDDTDFVIGDALRDSKKLITQLEQDNAALRFNMANEEILRGQLAIAVEALKSFAGLSTKYPDNSGGIRSIAATALKKIGGEG